RPMGSDNVLVAGRCIGTDRAANSAIRVKASCMAMGEAAGAAAKIAIDTREMHAEAVRRLLADTGAIVPTLDIAQ
ncbi:MAG: FAD-dependent oxidoreductase, partial [Eubacteriales bacterium]|nr:FAD-dependent oxidoreductase [Eubacteriales bacterium]MDY3941861.1 FAD-dependent oxidoreductase [Eubacteriales bacterium]